jgi:hypothetical protein
MEDSVINEVLKKIKEEGNSKDFECYSLKCHIQRHEDFGHLCGYVRVPKDHPLWGKNYNEPLCNHYGCLEHTVSRLIKVHGGLTFSGRAYWTEDKEGWWFGFDCAHAGDLIPFLHVDFPDEVYRDMNYVEKECRKLAMQLASITKEKIKSFIMKDR